MQYSYLQASLWAVLYVALALAPLALMLPEPTPPGRGFWVEFGVAVGFVGLSMLALQFLATGRFRDLAMGFGSDLLLQFHLATGVVAMALVLAHPAILILADTGYIEFFDPTVNFMRAFALVGAVVGVIFIVVTSLWRKRFNLDYEWWRLAHGVVAFLVLAAGLVHALQVGHFTDTWWKQAVVILIAGGGMALLVYTRLVKPALLKRFPYRVADVLDERADAHTLVIEPVDHRGMQFDPGQFAWITIKDTPYSLQQHPFSFSSSAEEPTRLTFTAKPLGDWTSTWEEIEPGTAAWLEGPYGDFTPRHNGPRGAVFFAGGIGITPIMSMLRTLADRGDEQPCVLFYANSSWDEVIFRDDIEELKSRLDLTVIYVLEDPPEGWEGEEGFIDHEMLDRHLPRPCDDYSYYICGPEPMMDIVETDLAGRDIPLRLIMTERFEIV